MPKPTNNPKKFYYDTALRKEWADALRSKKYVQGTKVLCSDDGSRCVMGVLIDLYMKKYPGRLKTTKRCGRTFYEDAESETSLILPACVVTTVGLRDAVGMFNDRQHKFSSILEEGTECSLQTINDRGISFEVLADIIADQKSGLFV